MVYCPVGFAHGFCVTSEIADVFYKQDAYYNDATERGISLPRPGVGIEWPIPADDLKPSQRDLDAPTSRTSPTTCRSSTSASSVAAAVDDASS